MIKSHIKLIRSLEHKKYRRLEGAFVAEGPKVVGELADKFHCRLLIATEPWMQQHPKTEADSVELVSDDELARVSLLTSPQQVLAVFELPTEPPDLLAPQSELCLALDGVQDPGNMGTIVRLADWFGIEHIYCSPGTVDAFNPKAVQASMGGLARVRVDYVDLPDLIGGLGSTPIYGTFLDGESIYGQSLSSEGLIVMGNEGNGISGQLSGLISRRLFVPNYPLGRTTTDSLNVAMATAIVCAEFRRRAAGR